MHPSQGAKASWFRQVRIGPEAMPDMRNIHQVGWPLVPVLWLQAKDKAQKPEVQGKAQSQNKEAGNQSGQANYCARKIE